MQGGAGGVGGRQGETGRGRGGQGEAWGDAWQCSFLSAVALVVAHWSLGCYIYQAAV